MNSIETCRRLGVSLTKAQRTACLYLERAGLRFCIEFGYGNCVEKAREHWRSRRRKR